MSPSDASRGTSRTENGAGSSGLSVSADPKGVTAHAVRWLSSDGTDQRAAKGHPRSLPRLHDRIRSLIVAGAVDLSSAMWRQGKYWAFPGATFLTPCRSPWNVGFLSCCSRTSVARLHRLGPPPK